MVGHEFYGFFVFTISNIGITQVILCIKIIGMIQCFNFAVSD